jgi:Na+/proline symporter
VIAGLIAILMSSMSACYNASATLVVRDFVMRYRSSLPEREQVMIGRRVTLLMAVLGILAAPLVGLSVTIWHYLQLVSAYLSVPLSAVIFLGLLWKRGNTAGAIAGAAAGFGLGIIMFLDQTLGWSLPVLSHPYMRSFLHRTLAVWLFAASVMIAVSLLNQPVYDYKTAGNELDAASCRSTAFSDYRVWAVLLFACTVALWWSFR